MATLAQSGPEPVSEHGRQHAGRQRATRTRAEGPRNMQCKHMHERINKKKTAREVPFWAGASDPVSERGGTSPATFLLRFLNLALHMIVISSAVFPSCVCPFPTDTLLPVPSTPYVVQHLAGRPIIHSLVLLHDPCHAFSFRSTVFSDVRKQWSLSWSPTST
jgi:hypothetical protein